MTLAVDPSPEVLQIENPARQEAFVRAELIRRLFDGSRQSRYFSFVLWPVIAAIYWRQVNLMELVPPFVAHLAVTVGFDVLRRNFARANPSDDEVVRWGWWFAGLSFLAGACWGVAGYMLASKDYELQRMLLGLVLLATITTAVPIRSAHPPTFYTFSLATTAPLLFVLLTSVDPFYQLVGIAGGAYVGHLMAYVRDVHSWQYDNIALAYQKEELARRLQAAYDEERLARSAATDAQRDAENANQAKSTFLATVSHEIRTPMNGVLGMIDVLERTPLSAEQRDALGTVRYSASSLLRIIDDILDFSKIEAGKLDLECIELSTIELIEGAAETLAPQAAAKGLKLAAYVDADVAERVMGDPLRLQQILFNLLGNAIKFTERGTVRLALENAGENLLRIRVVDSGIGLTDEQRERLFQPFVQADNTTTRRFGGTGLGLSIVRRLAQAMQGDVVVDSAPGVGSTFVVTVRLEPAPLQPTPAVLRGLSLVVALPDDTEARAIARYLGDAGAATSIAVNAAFTGIQIGLDRYIPMFDGPSDDPSAGVPRPWRRDVLIRAVARAAGRPAERPTRAAAATPERVGGRVLVVDDNSVNRKILARQLELAGASTDAAAGGEEALDLWRKGTYDLVLADLQMPSMDGFELARRIRENERIERRVRTPILAVTASALEDHEHKSRAVGMDGLITKPVGIEQLKATLDVWLKDARTERTP
jgi:signal transduction histidine kinase/ActR/RegA family two-component response regulator